MLGSVAGLARPVIPLPVSVQVVSVAAKEYPGDRVRRIRVNKEFVEGRKMSAKRLGELAGFEESYVLRIERPRTRTGIKYPGIETLRRLAEGLGVPVSEIAPPEYYGDRARDTLATVVTLIRADSNYTERAKDKAIASLREALGGKRAS